MRPALRRSAVVLGAVLALIAGIVIVRAVRFVPHRVVVPAATTLDPLPGAAERLAAAIRIPTISPGDSTQRDSTAFHAIQALLEKLFPRVHATMRREIVGRDAMLYTWLGTDTTLAPVVLMGHVDVVPVDPGTEARWTHPPFSGAVAGGYVWGRGTLDDKATVLGVLEASEALLSQGFTPRRTVYLAFGADEEVGGTHGAALIAARLGERGVRPFLVLDEGGTVVSGVVPGVRAPVAVVGIAEKGFASLELLVRAEGGHSAMPPRTTAAGILSRAVVRLEENPFPSGVRGAVAEQLDALGREMSFGSRMVFANRWLFDPLIRRQLARAPSTDATIRTTTAITMLEGSPKDNVLPTRARAVVNLRILPGDSVAGVVERVRRVVDDDRVEVRPLGVVIEPSPLSPTSDSAWTILERSIRQVYRDAVIVPYLVVGATDSRHLRGLTPNVYRFAGGRLEADDLRRPHGIDERISIESYLEGIRFLTQLVRNVAG